MNFCKHGNCSGVCALCTRERYLAIDIPIEKQHMRIAAVYAAIDLLRGALHGEVPPVQTAINVMNGFCKSASRTHEEMPLVIYWESMDEHELEEWKTCFTFTLRKYKDNA